MKDSTVTVAVIAELNPPLIRQFNFYVLIMFVNMYLNFLICKCYIDYDNIHITLPCSLATLQNMFLISVAFIYVLWLPHYSFQGTHELLFHKNLPHGGSHNKLSKLDGFCFDRGHPLVLIMTILLHTKHSSNTTFRSCI